LQKDKIRVYVLARELNMESKDLLDICKAAGYDVKNQLSSLEPEDRDRIVKLVQKKGSGVASPAPPPPPPVILPARVPVIPAQVHGSVKEPASQAAEPPVQVTAPPTPQAVPSAIPTPTAPAMPAPALAPAAAATAPAPPPTAPPRGPDAGRMRNLSQIRPRSGAPSGPAPAGPTAKAPAQEAKPEPRTGRPRFVTAPNLAQPPKARVQSPLKQEKKADEPAQKPLMKLPPSMKSGTLPPKDAVKEIVARAELGDVGTAVVEEDEDGSRRPGAVKGREDRHKKRAQRAKDRRSAEETQGRIRVGDDDDDRPALKVLKRLRQPQVRRGTQPRQGRVPLALPITVRSFCEATGLKSSDVLRKLIERGQMVTINAGLTEDLAEEIALEANLEIEIKKPLDAEEQLLATLQGEDSPDDLSPRAPIVTVMGHVDHGKTSLLDRIRESNVVATEAGGITQHLRAWRVKHKDHEITFLDTPGHEAFTQMRARGAQVTDIVVLVVAADDGVMPQTEEAISHAKAARVPIVVAINKVDLPNANLNKTKQQLYGMELIPDDMGGDTPFVETVATKDRARGIDKLLEMISLVAELKELKANHKKPGVGMCLEAKLSEGEGVVATLLVQSGTLRRGDVVVCGLAYGRVRAMYDDLGRPLEEAGPSMPARITGLDEVPNADDKCHVVPDLAMAREIAEKRRQRVRTAQPVKHATFRLEDLAKIKVAEIKLILKADVRGSIEAIKKELLKLDHEEVRVNVLHTGIGAITEGDVQLALASPEDTLIVGFNVVPDDRARSLADSKGVQIRQYDIIYNLTDDLRSALEGKLKPREEVVHLGRAIVRNTFKISRVGTVAGCYVTQGVIERSGRIRLIRDGVVIYPAPDKSATIESLRRVKDDVREVREGYECGIKLAGYDDIKVDDVIECFRVEQVMRTL
jgi:translation initiation factor IF-2